MGGKGEKTTGKLSSEKKVETRVEAARGKRESKKALKEFKEALDLAPKQKDLIYGNIVANLKKNPGALKIPFGDKAIGEAIFGDNGLLVTEARSVALANSSIWEKIVADDSDDVLKKMMDKEEAERVEIVAITFMQEVVSLLGKVKPDEKKHKNFTLDYKVGGKIEITLLTEEEVKKATEKAKKAGDVVKPAKTLTSDEEDAAVEAMQANPFYGFVLSFFGLVKIKEGATEAEEAAAYAKAYRGLINGKSKNPLNFFARLFLPVPGAEDAKKKLLANADKMGKEDFVSGVVGKIDGFLSPYKSYLELDTKAYMPIVLGGLDDIKFGEAFKKKAVLETDVDLAAAGDKLKIKVPKGALIDLKTSELGALTLVDAKDDKELKGRNFNALRDANLVLTGAIGADSRFGKGVLLERESVKAA
jgi:hypothetical protein